MPGIPSRSDPSKRPPRGYVPLEAAAEMLWEDGVNMPTDWAIAYVRIVAETQGDTGTGHNVDVDLRWWRADAGGTLYVRAKDIEPIRLSFLKWCGMLPPPDAPGERPSLARGRPRGSGIATDDQLVALAIQRFQTGKAKSLTNAALQVSKNADGASADANYHRLRKKVMSKWKEMEKERTN